MIKLYNVPNYLRRYSQIHEKKVRGRQNSVNDIQDSQQTQRTQQGRYHYNHDAEEEGLPPTDPEE